MGGGTQKPQTVAFSDPQLHSNKQMFKITGNRMSSIEKASLCAVHNREKLKAASMSKCRDY